jgi:hypothetical protein
MQVHLFKRQALTILRAVYNYQLLVDPIGQDPAEYSENEGSRSLGAATRVLLNIPCPLLSVQTAWRRFGFFPTAKNSTVANPTSTILLL